MDFSLRPLTEVDAPALQRVYEAAPAAFTRLLGRPALPGQAARDIAQALATPGRYQFGAVLDGELIGMLDCKISEEVPREAYLGLLLLVDAADPALARLMVRILLRWLVSALNVKYVETSALAHHPPEIKFWQSMGFDFTGRQYRRELADYAPRFLVLARDLTPGKEE